MYTVLSTCTLFPRLIQVCLQAKERAPSNADVSMQAFIGKLLDDHAEYRPDMDALFLNPAQFPSKTAIYAAYITAYLEKRSDLGHANAEPPLSKAAFIRKFNKWYSDVKLPKTNKFAQCDKCFSLRQKMDLAAGPNKQFWRDELEQHRTHARLDKAEYYKNR